MKMFGGDCGCTSGTSASDAVAVVRAHRGRASCRLSTAEGEARSSVSIRFTGRVYARDVNDVIDRIVKFNEIDDVSDPGRLQ
jgi:hypothetical protein